MKEKVSLKRRIINSLKGFSKDHVLFRKVAKKVYEGRQIRNYKKANKKYRTDKKLIYFNTFNGRSYGDTPKAMYEFMLEHEYFRDHKFVWMFRNPEKYQFLSENRNTTVVDFNSEEEIEATHKAGYWLTNYRMLNKFIPKDDQVYVQCWHGTPLKRLGCDLDHSDNAMNSSEEIYYKYIHDAERFKYIVSPSPFTTEKFTSAWDLKRLNKTDAIIEEGYPRNDRLINATEKDILELKESFDLPSDKKVILYTPTWRDNQYKKGVGYTYDVQVDFDKLKNELSDDYIILFRAHYLVANSFDFKKYEGFLYDVSDVDDINDLFLVSDILITDYSSVMFDYANLKKPMVFYMYDIEDYRDDIRGFYIDLEDLPGPILYDEESLSENIRSLTDGFVPDEKYMRFSEKYNVKDDGDATRRTLETIFNVNL